MPLALGSEWTYSVQGDFDTYVDKVRVAGRTPVGSSEGWRLTGTMGACRLAWSDGRLLASELAGQGFDPPIPVCSPTPMTWKGRWIMGSKTVECQATVESKKSRIQVADRSTETTVSVVELTSRGLNATLTTWFVPGVGIYRQEQRAGDRRTVRLDYLSGP